MMRNLEEVSLDELEAVGGGATEAAAPQGTRMERMMDRGMTMLNQSKQARLQQQGLQLQAWQTERQMQMEREKMANANMMQFSQMAFQGMSSMFSGGSGGSMV
jgi:hypothetical protein